VKMNDSRSVSKPTGTKDFERLSRFVVEGKR
jgi:hypothetical protein